VLNDIRVSYLPPSFPELLCRGPHAANDECCTGFRRSPSAGPHSLKRIAPGLCHSLLATAREVRDSRREMWRHLSYLKLLSLVRTSSHHAAAPLNRHPCAPKLVCAWTHPLDAAAWWGESSPCQNQENNLQVPKGKIKNWNCPSESRDSSVGIALGHGLDDRSSRVRFPAGAGNFSLHRVQNGSGAHPASYLMGTGDCFPGDKAAGEWSWPLTSI
jgi:hypothetical protein